jgi:formate hydrogenlyase subunit 4
VTILLSLLTELLHIGLMLAAAPTAAGVAQWLDARLAGRTGPSILLPWRDLVRLSRKTPMLSESTSVVSRIAPTAALAATLTAAALVPSFTLGMALSPLADLLVIAALLSAARAAIALAALDSGAALAGLAQQGAGARAVVAEPAMMLVVVALALMGGSFNLDLIIGQQRDGVLLPAAASALALTALVALLLADVSAADPDPSDHVVSGMDLAMLRTTGWLRRLIWIDLIGGLFLPVGIAGTDSLPLAWLIGLAAWAFKLAAVVLCLSAARSLIGPIPRQGLPDLIGVAALLALLATIMVLAGSAPV